MKHAAVKSELEEGPMAFGCAWRPRVIADPRGTAVNKALLLQSPRASRAFVAGRQEHTEPNPLSWPQPRLKEIGGGEQEQGKKVPARSERGICV